MIFFECLEFCVLNVVLVCVGNKGMFLVVVGEFLLIEILVSKFIYLVICVSWVIRNFSLEGCLICGWLMVNLLNGLCEEYLFELKGKW